MKCKTHCGISVGFVLASVAVMLSCSSKKGYYQKLNEEYLNEFFKNYSRRIGFKNTNDFRKEIKKNNIKIDSVIKKITIEAFWNQLIIDKFLKNVKINEANIKKELQNQKIQREYLLSEILFGLEKNNELDNKMKLIKKAISDEGFSKAALIHSISDTSNSRIVLSLFAWAIFVRIDNNKMIDIFFFIRISFI